jgi:hypothetical protein
MPIGTLLQTVASALASDAINAPTDMDNAAHIESLSSKKADEKCSL